MRITAFKIDPRTVSILVFWAQAGIDSGVGRAHGSQADRELIRRFARYTGLGPPDFVSTEIQKTPPTLPPGCPQLDVTAKLAGRPAERDDPNFYYRRTKGETHGI